jgi:Leucine-rich repeat (LRR) protein
MTKESTNNFKNYVKNCSPHEKKQLVFAVKTGLTTLNDSPFENMPKLEKLYLSENFLSRLDKRSFFGLVDLKKLDLSLNVLSKLGAYTFSNLTSLQVLLLNGNQLVSIGARLFKYNVNLKKLKLSNNLLKALTWNQATSSANDLQLHNNNLTNILGISNFPNLTALTLSNNIELQLNASSFAGVPKLQNVSLDNSNLLQLNYKFSIFSPLQHLIFLNISNNQLVKVNFTQFPAMESLEYFHIELNTIEELDQNISMRIFPKLKFPMAVMEKGKRTYHQSLIMVPICVLVVIALVCIIMVVLLVLSKLKENTFEQAQSESMEEKIKSGVYFRSESFDPWERENSNEEI